MRRHLQSCLAILVVLACQFMAPVLAFGFTGKEHVDISNMALQIALDRLAAEQGECAAQRDVTDLANFLTVENVASRQSYGDLVALVDYINDPEGLFNADGAKAVAPGDVSAIDWRHVKAVQGDVLAKLQALHLNEGHFQNGALLRHTVWHAAALDIARDHLVMALLLEAYADHFLEDFFAPGHVMTPRSSTVDMQALALHDAYNRKEVAFCVRPEAAAQILALSDGLARAQSVPGNGLHISDGELNELRSDLKTSRVVKLEGDNTLARRGKEAAFLTLVVARSILDVLEAKCAVCERKNNFEVRNWTWPPVLPGAVGNAIGDYDIQSRPGDDLSGFMRHSFGSVVVPSVSLDVFPRGNIQQIRPEVGLDLPLATVVPRVESWVKAITSLYGVSFAADQHNQIYGFHLLGLYPMKDIDSQVTLSYGVNYLTAAKPWIRPQTAVGIETGFGLFFLHFGLGYDYFVDTAEHLHAGLILRSGVSLSIPLRGRVLGY